MATESQITKFALFATNNCVQPEEKEEYENFSTALWSTLAPADPVIYPAYLPTQTAIGRRPNVRPGRHAPRQSRPRQMQTARKKAPPPFCKSNPIQPGSSVRPRTLRPRIHRLPRSLM
jgi:hypothetical protein